MSVSWVSSFDHMASAAIFQLLMHITVSACVKAYDRKAWGRFQCGAFCNLKSW